MTDRSILQVQRLIPLARRFSLLALTLATAVVSLHAPVAASAFPRHGMQIVVLPGTGPRTTRFGGTITFHLRVQGMHLVARSGTHPTKGAGHLQIYLDTIPSDAYRRADLQHHWLASLAATTFPLRFPAAVLNGRRGHHTILIALAGTNDVLYRIPAAQVEITVR